MSSNGVWQNVAKPFTNKKLKIIICVLHLYVLPNYKYIINVEPMSSISSTGYK
jgi:hypothetical protein